MLGDGRGYKEEMVEIGISESSITVEGKKGGEHITQKVRLPSYGVPVPVLMRIIWEENPYIREQRNAHTVFLILAEFEGEITITPPHGRSKTYHAPHIYLSVDAVGNCAPTVCLQLAETDVHEERNEREKARFLDDFNKALQAEKEKEKGE